MFAHRRFLPLAVCHSRVKADALAAGCTEVFAKHYRSRNALRKFKRLSEKSNRRSPALRQPRPVASRPYSDDSIAQLVIDRKAADQHLQFSLQSL